MAPTKKQLKNPDYCKQYRQKNLEALRKKDKERKKFEREYRKYCEREKYEEHKKKERERKANKKVNECINEFAAAPVTPSSSFKHKSTKVRSLKKAENALPNSPSKKKEIISSLAAKYQLRVALLQKKPGPKRSELTEDQIEWLVRFLILITNIYYQNDFSCIYLFTGYFSYYSYLLLFIGNNPRSTGHHVHEPRKE